MTLRSLLLTATLLASALLHAEIVWRAPLQAEFDAVGGRGWSPELTNSYARIPTRLQPKVTPSVWGLSQCSAGLYVDFETDATEIRVRYTTTRSAAMPHMPATGVSGCDLYAITDQGAWLWCAPKYSIGKNVAYTFSGLTCTPAAFRLFLPLYNTTAALEIGVEEKAAFRFKPVPAAKPIVAYGTSITQGACATRPGLAWPAILMRESGIPVINFGFSGSAKMEPGVFEALAELDPAVYIIDCMPNLSGTGPAKLVYDRTLFGIRTLRKARTAPIILVEHSGYTGEYTSASRGNDYKVANAELRRAYEALLTEGVKDLHYITKADIAFTSDSMVEGVHPNDLGMLQQAHACLRKLKEIQ